MKPYYSWRRLNGLLMAASLLFTSRAASAGTAVAADVPAVSLATLTATKTTTTTCDECAAIILVNANDGSIAIDHGLDGSLPVNNRSLFESAVGGSGKPVYMCLKNPESNPYTITLAPDTRTVADLSMGAPCFELPSAHLGYQQVTIGHQPVDRTKSKWSNLLVLPTDGVNHNPPQFLWLDAASNRAIDERQIRPVDGETMRVWAFNVKVGVNVDGKPSPQTFGFGKGPPVASSPLGPLIAYGMSALGTTIGLTPTPPSPAGSPAAAQTSITVQCGSDACKVPTASPSCGAAPTVANTDRTWLYGAGINFTQVAGGFNYIAQISDNSVGDQVALPGVAAQPAPVVASQSIETYKRHRSVSLGVEEAWNEYVNANYGPSGDSYVPVTQGGPDQIYQLQGIYRVADDMTTSLLGLVYPCSLFTTYRCTSGWGNWVLGLGPTLVRGSSAEALKQWNARLGYEFVDHVIAGVGVSWRSVDVPTAALGSLVSVPKPAMPPSFATTPDWKFVFSVGVTVDLDVINEGIASVSSAVSSGTKAAGK